MRTLLLLLLTIPCSAQHVAQLVNEEWVLVCSPKDTANVLLDSAGNTDVIFTAQEIVQVDSSWIVGITGASIMWGSVGTRQLLQRKGNYLDAKYDTCMAMFTTLCCNTICCSTCKARNTDCYCYAESCPGGACDKRTFSALPTDGISNGIKRRLLQ